MRKMLDCQLKNPIPEGIGVAILQNQIFLCLAQKNRSAKSTGVQAMMGYA